MMSSAVFSTARRRGRALLVVGLVATMVLGATMLADASAGGSFPTISPDPAFYFNAATATDTRVEVVTAGTTISVTPVNETEFSLRSCEVILSSSDRGSRKPFADLKSTKGCPTATFRSLSTLGYVEKVRIDTILVVSDDVNHQNYTIQDCGAAGCLLEVVTASSDL